MPAIQRANLRALNTRFSQTGETEQLSHAPASISLLLGTGGDRRIWPDAITRRNRYGTLAVPADDEISFSSTTASNVSAEGFLAAGVALRRLIDLESPSPVAYDQWFADIRDAIPRNLGCVGAEVVLAASGTDAELIALCLFAGLSKRPLTNVLVAPDETGNGVPRAAAGCHYSDLTALGGTVEAGAPLEGLPPGRIEVRTIAIRNETGEPRHQHEIDADVIATVELELRRDRDVLVHVLDTSKTGLPAVTRQAARHVAALAPGRVHIIVDACQFRGSISSLRQDLADGFVVALTGSKFIAGPPFSGALLIPSALALAFDEDRHSSGPCRIHRGPGLAGRPSPADSLRVQVGIEPGTGSALGCRPGQSRALCGNSRSAAKPRQGAICPPGAFSHRRHGGCLASSA
ncbi:hypothetical protein LGH82_30920 [Mesorhizobium sp. PAMC28654]|uniref:hypothetical protein n=1 Tax=Mesorhizobium sp. PAMC28654 TaxID=2880934 RepID=UPI001D0A497A|nr:hypothetical protein [Mesorhizobium sp. PAMC28654]UDL89422.1 hypothetical protein LGH82_30920 [Mesorhizobium sp. PAMC28654]